MWRNLSRIQTYHTHIKVRQLLTRRLHIMQEIAGQGFFSLGMLARFEPALREKGASMYPRLFWETGLIGQVLYLEAHAFGVSATGIGCFFDDPGEIVDPHLSCPILKPSSVICMSNCIIEYCVSFL